MVVRIVIGGRSQCEIFAEVCLVSDYLSQHLPNFCWERIEVSVVEWDTWLLKVNQKNKWHHIGSPIAWKEMLMKGSKPYYIGGAPEFLEYCDSYYKFDTFMAPLKMEGLSENFAQYHKRIALEQYELGQREARAEIVDTPDQTSFVVCISGAANPMTMHLISGLLDLALGEKSISKIYIHDEECSEEFMYYVEHECSYVDTSYPGKVVKYVNRIGVALTTTDLLIILNHVPFEESMPIGDWLHKNHHIMSNLSIVINATASRKMCILFPNLGPACYNATVLSQLIHINKNNVVVATTDLGLEISATAAEIAEVSLRNMFCPPVWGFVGINHLVDVKTTVTRYDSFEPYNRFLKVRNSTLTIGKITPDLRTLEYLMYFDDTLWTKVVANKNKFVKKQEGFNKVLAVVNTVRVWLFDRDPEIVVSLGIRCTGAFGLSFRGKFSQPARFVDGEWEPAEDYLLPKDFQMKLPYLEEMAEFAMDLQEGDLPKLEPYCPCYCKKREYKKSLY